MSKTFKKLRDFNAEKEPKMGTHEQAVYDAISRGDIERVDLVKMLEADKKKGLFATEQDLSGFLSFHQRSLRLRGLIEVEVTPSEGSGKARKDTISVKVISRTRDFDTENEPKMGDAEAVVYSLITYIGVRRPDLVIALEAKIKAGEYETAQKPSGMISFNLGNLRKRALISIVTTEEARPVKEDDDEKKDAEPEAEVEAKGKDKKAT